ncbi:MAG TPA: hypothetical protein VNR63_07425 [Gaiellaceae bacterium]|nr:hypothetical protein [Gaiellaceae bacterium]
MLQPSSRNGAAAAELRPAIRVTYELWLASWETALAALATGARSRALSLSEAAAHGAVIRAERELVTKHFTLLLGDEVLAEAPVPVRTT